MYVNSYPTVSKILFETDVNVVFVVFVQRSAFNSG